MYKFSLRTAAGVLLILISCLFVFSQQHNNYRSQVIEGCSEEVSNYPGQNYVIEASSGRRTPVDRIETGHNRYVFTFRPSDTRIQQGQKLKFSAFTYGREQPGPNGREPEAIEDLYLERRGNMPGERDRRLNWDQTPYASVRQTGPWYAIYSYAGPGEPTYGTYILPLREDELPADWNEADVWPNPLNRYSYRGYPPSPRTGPPARSTVKRLPSNMQFDTAGMKPGFYWFTLQSDAVFDRPHRQTCSKTTPPVLIEIVKNIPPPPRVTKIDVKVKAGSTDCASASATATVSLTNVSPRDISIRWTIRDQNNREITPDYTTRDGKTVAVNRDLRTGRYTFTADVLYGAGRSEASDTATTGYICPGGGAGLVYFQYEVPDTKKPGKVIDPRDPEGWAGGDPAGRTAIERAPYPTGQFTLFYETTDAQQSADDSMTDNNTRQLDEIVEMLHTYPGYLLKIFGYADFQKTSGYSNELLSERRIKAVKDYLVFKYRKEYGRDISYRISGRTVTEARGARFAQSCDPYKWTDPRRWDRRTELIFTKDPDQPNPVYPPAPGCPQPQAKAPGKKPYRIPDKKPVKKYVIPAKSK